MKKALAGLMLATAFLLPSVSFAQTVDNSQEIAALERQIDLLNSLISLLMQIKDLQASANQDISTIKTNTAPAPVATGNSVDNTVTVKPFEVYELQWNAGDDTSNFLAHTTKDVNVDQSTVDGSALSKVASITTDQCDFIWTKPNDYAQYLVPQNSEEQSAVRTALSRIQRCGVTYHVRLAPGEALTNGNHTVHLVSTDGDALDLTVPVKN
jgi:hypothetical protein